MAKATYVVLVAVLALSQLAGTAALARPGRGVGGVGGPGVAGPAGPGRVAARRTVIATSTYVRTLPVGCVATDIDGTAVYHCGAQYYQAHNGQYVLVTVK